MAAISISGSSFPELAGALHDATTHSMAFDYGHAMVGITMLRGECGERSWEPFLVTQLASAAHTLRFRSRRTQKISGLVV